MNDSLKEKKVLVVEDDDAFDLWIGIVLKRLGLDDYKRVKIVEEANRIIDNEWPDLIISDVFLEGKLTGVDLVKKSFKHSIPTIIITSSTCEELYRKIQNFNNVTYLVKPFLPLTLIAAVESLMFGRFNDSKAEKLKAPSFFVKFGSNKNAKIYLSDIYYLESDGNYTYIHTKNRKIALRKSISKVMDDFDDSFIRCHRTFCVNRIHITAWSSNSLTVGETVIPIGRSYLKLVGRELMSK